MPLRVLDECTIFRWHHVPFELKNTAKWLAYVMENARHLSPPEAKETTQNSRILKFRTVVQLCSSIAADLAFSHSGPTLCVSVIRCRTSTVGALSCETAAPLIFEPEPSQRWLAARTSPRRATEIRCNGRCDRPCHLHGAKGRQHPDSTELWRRSRGKPSAMAKDNRSKRGGSRRLILKS